MDLKKTAVIRNYPTPRTVEEVRSFLGMNNFYRRVIRHYTDEAYDLTKLLRGNSTFFWGPQQEASFQCLKDALVKPPMLAMTDFSKEMILSCDASYNIISFIYSATRLVALKRSSSMVLVDCVRQNILRKRTARNNYRSPPLPGISVR